jgi:hypothetical protein
MNGSAQLDPDWWLREPYRSQLLHLAAQNQLQQYNTTQRQAYLPSPLQAVQNQLAQYCQQTPPEPTPAGPDWFAVNRDCSA